MTDLFVEMERRYREGELPWDDPLPPPEVIDLAQQLPPGRALDLGCGLGRACIELARRGWQCDGVDFVPQAIAQAQRRATAAGVAERIRFHVAPVTRLGFLQSPYDLALDVGCLHGQRGDELYAYAAELSRLVRPGGHYLLFAGLRDAAVPEETRGLPEQTMRALLEPTFTITRVEHGVTNAGGSTWASAWFWMQRKVHDNGGADHFE
jgi:SAM-dependent methyltransferase